MQEIQEQGIDLEAPYKKSAILAKVELASMQNNQRIARKNSEKLIRQSPGQNRLLLS